MKKIPLLNRKGIIVAEAMVDDEVYPKIFEHTWRLEKHKDSRTGYAKRYERVNGTFIVHNMARIVLGLDDNDRRVADHIDGNGLNNQRSNLRACSVAENCRNRPAQANNIHSAKGVTWFGRNKKRPWRVIIYKNKKQHLIGYYPSKDEAVEASRAAIKRLHGEFANVG